MSQSVKLISVTPDAEKTMAYCARVSSPHQDNPEYSGLLRYCIKHGHWSVFEMATMCIEIVTSRAIAQQILRHRSFSFQEFCISGDSLITTILPSSGLPSYLPIKKLYERQKWKNYKNINLRIYDEKTKSFTTAKLKEVFKTGKKESVKITFDDGKNITCTPQHKFLTKNGWFTLEDALGLKFIKDRVIKSKNELLAVNGQPAHQSFEWMKEAKIRSLNNKIGVIGIANEAGVSYHTIRKWLKKHNLSFSKKETSSMYPIWNKGFHGYKLKSRTDEQRQHMRDITPRGKFHRAYKGGSASHRKAIANYFNPLRKSIFEKNNYTCQFCFKKFEGKIEIHHIKPVSTHPELAYDLSNVIPVHRKCHMEYHGKSDFFRKELPKNRRGNLLVPRFKKVVSVEFVGEIETYDLEVDHDSHNYVANKILVHNSQRYAAASDVIFYEARRQDDKNRQNSFDDLSDADKEWFAEAQKICWERSKDFYDEAIKRGIAKECARFVLPLNVQTKMYMIGSVRSWIHYLEQRTKPGVQKEHRDIAIGIKSIFSEQFPETAKALEWL